MNNKILVSCLALALTACGTPKKATDANKDNGLGVAGQGQRNPGDLSDGDFRSQCTDRTKHPDYPNSVIIAQNGNNFCITYKRSIVDQGYDPDHNPTHNPPKILLDNSYSYGKFILAKGVAGEAILTLNDREISSNINMAGLGPNENGQLSIQVLEATSAEIEVNEYVCLDSNMHTVWCNPGQIPGHNP